MGEFGSFPISIRLSRFILSLVYCISDSSIVKSLRNISLCTAVAFLWHHRKKEL